MTTLAALIERLEKAEAGSRELDEDIARAVLGMGERILLEGMPDDHPGVRFFTYLDGTKGTALRYTTSIDAALTLVPADGYWQCERLNIEGETRGFGYATVNYEHEGLHPVPSLALCIAALRARGARHD